MVLEEVEVSQITKTFLFRTCVQLNLCEKLSVSLSSITVR